MKNPNAEVTSYILVSELLAEGSPFGYVEGDHFAIIAPAENKCYLATDEGEITSTNWDLDDYLIQAIINTVNDVYPSVNYLTYKIKQFSVGDEVKIESVI